MQLLVSFSFFKNILALVMKYISLMAFFALCYHLNWGLISNKFKVLNINNNSNNNNNKNIFTNVILIYYNYDNYNKLPFTFFYKKNINNFYIL